MLKKNIKYVDFNGSEREEDYYFHLSVPEATKIASEFGMSGMEKGINKMIEDGDINAMVLFIEKVILGSYGEKTTDGRAFMKTPELREKFEYSQAYANLFEELLETPDTMKAFVEGLTSRVAVKKEDKVVPI